MNISGQGNQPCFIMPAIDMDQIDNAGQPLHWSFSRRRLRRVSLAGAAGEMQAERGFSAMSDDQGRAPNGRSAAPPCSLREACLRAGLDRRGERCPTCPVRDLCQSDVRWLIRPPKLH
jgi:hypothetical protein